ncbi:hypothetical protein GCM10011386_46950 [Parapedobacter defluvii]|uniref:Cytochrome c domain-containing protein n=1 Tax=Parapedobacter defluvii TaxID=2045106 RepID=A0ABQ1MY04_9SPHI|nr:cytochrome c [Parapedobacter defluvii]GGC49265.1 hypothetical protein GCM10011386_46950 [Parapedobacter defluvii]
MKKLIVIMLMLLIVTVAGTFFYVKFALPDVGAAPKIKVELTPERIQRGEYLANHVAACMDCHSTRNWGRYSGPLQEGTLGKGGEYFGPEMGFPGKFYSKNLTPANLENWTDGEIFRAITSGVNKDGKALFPVMPYPYYAQMDKEDVLDIIAYIRSLPVVENEVPQSVTEFPMSLIINTMPVKPSFVTRPKKENKAAYGKYLVTAAACMDCHSPVNKGQVIAEKAFSGGREFELPRGILRSANITPDTESGIGNWTEEMFVARFKTYQHPENMPSVKPDDYNTLMPWSMYAGMETDDLEAIYMYLQSLKPIENAVVRYTQK